MRRLVPVLCVALLTSLSCLVPGGSVGAQTLIGNIGASGSPLAVNPRTNRIYLNNSGGNSIVAVDGYTHTVTNLPMLPGTFVAGVSVNPLSNRLYVHSSVGSMAVLDGDSHGQIGTLSGFGAVAFDLARGRVYLPTGSSLRVLSMTDDSEITEVAGVSGFVIAVDPLANQIFVVSADAGTMNVIDGSSYAVQNISGLSGPVAIALQAQTRRVYVAEYWNSNVAEFDAQTLVRTDIAVPERPSNLVADAVANRIFVGHNPTSTSAAAVTVIDGATRATTPIAVGARPAALAFDAGSRRLYAVNQLSGSTSVIDVDTQTVVAGLATCPGSQATHATVNPVTHRAYVHCLSSSTLAVIDGATLDVATHSPGTSVSAMVFDGVQRRLLGLDYSANLRLIDPVSGSVTPFAPIAGDAVQTLAYDAGANRIVTRHASGQVALTDGASLAVTTLTPGGGYVSLIGVDAARGRYFLVDNAGDAVRVLDGTTLAVTTVAVADAPYYVEVDPADGSAFIGHNGTVNQVTRIDGATLAVSNHATTAKPQRMVLDRARQRLFVGLQNTARVAVLNTSTLAVSDVNLVAAAASMGLNPRRGVLWIGHAGVSETRVSLLNTTTLAAPTTLVVGGNTQRILVDAVHDRVGLVVMDSFTANYSLVVARGPSNALVTRALSGGPATDSLSLDPLLGRMYFAVASDVLRLNTEPLPPALLTTTVSGGHSTAAASAALGFSVISGSTPNATTPLAVFARSDYGAWQAATPGAPGAFSLSLPLELGAHHLQAFALDQFGATTQGGLGTASTPINSLHAGAAGRVAGQSITRVVPTSIATTTSFDSITPSPSVVGQVYVVAVIIGSSGPTPTGAVNVDDGAGHACVVTLSGGRGSCMLTGSNSGSYTITAAYAGSGLLEPSSATTTHVVAAAATTTTIVADLPDPSVPNQTVTVQVAVAAQAPGAGVPGGSVEVTVLPGGVTCSGALVAGAMSCAPAFSANGDYTLTATYAGNADFATSTSAVAPHRVEAGADLALTISDGSNEQVAGTSTSYTITLVNGGPMPVANARLREQLAATMTPGAWTCSASAGASCIAGQPAGTAAAGSGALDQFVDAPVGAQVQITHTVTLASAHVGVAIATAQVESAVADPDWGNNSASDSNSTRRVADLAVTKSNQCFYVPAGGHALYAISVSNSGPSDAPGTRVVDAPNGILAADSWFCSPSGGATCAPSGVGNLDALVDIPAGGQVLIGFLVAVGDGPPDTVTNTATISPHVSVEDSTAGNNSASDTDRVALFASGFEFDCPLP